MKVVSVVNYKGGVGKTSVVANLVAGFAIRGYKVLVIDLDPQASLTFSFMSVEKWKNKYRERFTIKNWYDSYLNAKARDFRRLFIDDLEVNNHLKQPITLIASHLDLFKVEIELAQNLKCLGKRKMAIKKLEILHLLDTELKKLQKNFDIVFIDCQPNFGMITQEAIIASDYYLVPTRLDYLSSLGGATLKRHIKELVGECNQSIEDFTLPYQAINVQLLGTIPTMIQSKGLEMIEINRQYEEELKKQNLKCFNTRIRFNQTVMGQDSKIPIILRKCSGRHEKLLAEEFENLMKEMIKEMQHN